MGKAYIMISMPLYIVKAFCMEESYVTVSWKTDQVVTNTDIQFLPVAVSHTHALSRDTKHSSLDRQVCFFAGGYFPML